MCNLEEGPDGGITEAFLNPLVCAKDPQTSPEEESSQPFRDAGSRL